MKQFPSTDSKKETDVSQERSTSCGGLTGGEYLPMSLDVENLVTKLCEAGSDLERSLEASHNRVSSLALSAIRPNQDAPIEGATSIPSQTHATKQRELNSLSFLQEWLAEAAIVLGNRIAVVVTNKRGKVIDWSCRGWDPSVLRVNEDILGSIAKKAILRGEMLCSIQQSNDDPLASHQPSCSAPLQENDFRTSSLGTSICTSLNRLSQAFESPIASIAIELPQSSGFAVLVLDTSAGLAGTVKIFDPTSQSKHLADVAYLMRDVDNWLLIRRCRWSIKWTERLEWLRTNPKVWLAPVAVLLLGLLIPVPYYPRRECVFEPEVRQYVSSPVAGHIASCNVRPGDQVEKGQLLAQLDGEQMRRDLSTAQAELEGATKKFDTALATRTAGEMGIAKVEVRRAQARIESLRDQLDRLEVRAVAPGTVVQGDWMRSIGMPVTLGQNLFEIAELESMTVELHLNAIDLGQIKVGNKVAVRSDATGGKSFQGTIGRIEPRATIVDQQAVFIADVIIKDPNLQLRPGMKANAQIEAGWRSIGWLLFSKPYRWLANQWIW